jgi:RNA polymerase sigma factor (sigma-70 family)
MSRERLGIVVECIRALADASGAGEGSDRQLLKQFAARREESAFAALMKRHGPMVLGVCRRISGHVQDAEDAFQATFLLLARKAGTIHRRDSIAGWLHGVAYRVAWKARKAMVRRQQREKRAARPEAAAVTAACGELQAALDDALRHLPEKYRTALLLCYFEGRTVEEAARLLGCPRGTVASRLARGRHLLRLRLARRGLALSTAAVTTLLLTATTDAASTLFKTTVKASIDFAGGQAAARVVSPAAAALVAGGLRGTFLTKGNAVALLLLTLSGIVAGAGVIGSGGADQRAESRTNGADQATGEKPREVETQARTDDAAGDPLPADVFTRLGTLRFRSPDHVYSLIFSSDGKVLISQATDGVRLWETRTGKELKFFPGEKNHNVTACDISPDGRRLAILSHAALAIWDISRGAIRDVYGFRFSIVRFAPDGKTLLTAGPDPGPESIFKVWDLATATVVRSWKGPQSTIASAIFTPDGKTVVTACGDRTIRFWDMATGRETRRIDAGPSQVAHIALSPDGARLAWVGSVWEQLNAHAFSSRPDNFIRVWDLAAGKELRKITGQAVKKDLQGGISDVAFLADGNGVLGCGPGPFVRCWDLATGLEKVSMACTFNPFGLACSPDGKLVATAVNARTIRLFDTTTGKSLAPEGWQLGIGNPLVLSRDGRSLALIGDYTTIEFWNPLTGRPRSRLQVLQKPNAPVGLAAVGNLAFCVGEDKAVRALDMATGKEVRRFLVNEAPDWGGVAASADGKTLALATKAKAVLLVDAMTGKERKRLTGDYFDAQGLAFVDGGKKLALWSGDHKLHVWDAAGGHKLLQFPFPQDRGPQRPTAVGGGGMLAYTAVTSPDGRLIAYGSQEKYLVLMEVLTGKEIACFRDLPDGVSAIAFSPDGRTVAWGGWRDPAVRLLETATGGKERRRLLGHKGRILSLVFSADSNILVSGSMDTTVLVWNLTGQHRKERRARLSEQELETCWSDLAGADAIHAYDSIRKLARDPDGAVAFLGQRLQRVPQVNAKDMDRLIADLDSDQFAVREKATRSLEKLAELAVPACRAALKGQPAIEVRRRLQRLLDKEQEQWHNPPPDLLRRLRALEVLELAGTPLARDTLAKISQGASAARLTRDAKASLERFARRSSSGNRF